MSIIHLVSGPRNLSTALMYSFAQRQKCTVVDEPYYAHYLTVTGKDHPGKQETLATQSSEATTVTAELKELANKNDELFIKNMAHHIRLLDYSILDGHKIIILIRNPKALITSFSKVITNPNIDDIGLKDEYIISEFLDKKSMDYVVLDSGELLKNPRAILQQLCRELNITYQESMLSWPSGKRKFDGAWAPYWYSSVHASTGFSPQKRFFKKH